ncbi:MAG: PAS domain-containing protein [Puniceicoccales bacterium]|nr:PAS domain-containing protein [Puniceicoccales bacterium]
MKKSISDKICARLESLNKVELNSFIQHVDRERQLLDAIFNVLQEAIVLVNANGMIEFCNQAALKLLGLKENEKNNMPLWKWMPSIKKVFSVRENALKPDIIEQEVDLLYPEKRFVRLHLQVFPETNENEKRFIIILYDITQETIANEERLVQERLDSVVQLASEVAHELGNPLNSIAIHLQLIERKIHSIVLPEALTRSLQVCTAEVNRLNEIIKYFLQAVRPQKIQLREENLVKLVEKVLSTLAPQLSNLNINVELDAQEASLPNIKVDKARIHQAFFNLLKNAIEAIGTDGWIRISFFTDSSDFVVAFADSGTGMSETQAAHLFGTQKTTSKPQGHGIGMLIVRRIMQEHKGLVALESKMGFGTIIYLKFPLPQKYLKKLSDQTLTQ